MSAKIGTNPQVTIKPSQLPAEKLKENSSFLKPDTQALSNLNEKIVSKDGSIQKTNKVDETSEVKPESFKTNGGSWRTRDAVAGDPPRFYRDGELTFGTKRVDTEYYKDSKKNQWVRLNGNGSLYNSPAYNGKQKPADVSDFQWQGWKVVAESQVPADYTTEGKTISLSDSENATDQQTVLRKYLQQNIFSNGGTNIAERNEQAVKRAMDLGVKIETEKAGVNEKGEAIYKVKISDEDLAKLRQVKTEWNNKEYNKPKAEFDVKGEVHQMFIDPIKLAGNFPVRWLERTLNIPRDLVKSYNDAKVVPLPGLSQAESLLNAGFKAATGEELPKIPTNGEVFKAATGMDAPEIPELKIPRPFEYQTDKYKRDGKTGEEVGATILDLLLLKRGMSSGSKSPQSLKTLGGIPEVEATTATQTARSISTGARELSIYDFKGAEKVYSEIRASKTDVSNIAKNTGIKEYKINRIKEHIFNRLHKLDDGVRHFDADPEIANAWKRLENGKHTSKDLKFLEHEYFESKFENLFKTTYRKAHDAANRSDRPSGLE